MRDIGYRRDLLERLAVRLSDLAQAHAWAAHARDLVSGALELCELADDAAWTTLLEMVLEEVADAADE